MSRQEAVAWILANGGKQIFTVKFIKRTDGTLRTMNCRLRVTKYLAGGPAAYDPKEHNLICVFDMQKMAYRSISIEGIVELNGVAVEEFAGV